MQVKISLHRLLLRTVTYSILFGIFVSCGFISGSGSILKNVMAAFILWLVPQVFVHFFFRNQPFGMGKAWFLRGFIYAAGLVIFLNQGFIVPDGNFLSNLLAGLSLYAISYIGCLFFR